MASKFLVTNRGIRNEYILSEGEEIPNKDKLSQERIERLGLEEARLRTRYGRIQKEVNLTDYQGDPNDIITLYPHREDDDADFSASQDTRFGSKAMFGEMHEDMCSAAGGDLLIYVHGYNNDLDKAIRNLGTIEEHYIKEGSPIKHLLLFSWPSQGKKIKYRNDMKDAEESGQALARNIMKLQKFYETYFKDGDQTFCGRKIHILAHSSGARVLQHAMNYLRNGQYGMNIGVIFEEAILAAADVDDFMLETHQPLGYLCEISNRVHNYNNKKDVALTISRTTKNSNPRLGQKGVRGFSNLPSNLVMVDTTGVKEDTGLIDDLINHWYYYTASDVVNDIIAVLNGKAAIEITKKQDGKRKEWPGKSQFNLYWMGEG